MSSLPNLIDGNRVALPMKNDEAEATLARHGFVVTHDWHPDMFTLFRWAALPDGWTATQDDKLRISDAAGRPMFHVRPANEHQPEPTLWVKNHNADQFEERAEGGWITYVPRGTAA